MMVFQCMIGALRQGASRKLQRKSQSHCQWTYGLFVIFTTTSIKIHETKTVAEQAAAAVSATLDHFTFVP